MTPDEQRILNILNRHTPKIRSDQYGTRTLSMADRIQLMSMTIGDLRAELEKAESHLDRYLSASFRGTP